MSDSTLVLSAAASGLTAALYGYVGYRLQGRKVSPAARLAQGMFVTWWYGIGVMSLLGAVAIALYRAQALPIWLYGVYSQLAIALLMVALWALMAYLVYLYTGSRRALLPVTVLYVAFYLALLGLVEYIGTPTAIVDDGWQLRTEPELELAGWAVFVFVIALLGPQVGATIAYARLYRKAGDATQRYRIAMVSGAILTWFGASIVAGAVQAESLGWNIASRILSLLAAGVILLAYLPPAKWRERYGLRALGDEGATETSAAHG